MRASAQEEEEGEGEGGGGRGRRRREDEEEGGGRRAFLGGAVDERVVPFTLYNPPSIPQHQVLQQ